ncbi:redoxin domain-containing protein [Winogradskyella sp. 3972H.M.0a.05]|uniref:TlpA disulfide reductase family protein n=1 Tax=Winogradskyella sp. 3972H.M.0a.05 TaxID=2950277 RepID=UPI003391B776
MRYVLLVILCIVFSCKNEPKQEEPLASVNNVEINEELVVVDFEGLKPYLNKTDGKTYVVNFWATWCAPCVKELPYFEQLNTNYKDKGVEVLLVSLDFPRKYESKLKPFIKDKNLKSRVIAFDDVDQNTWIPAINESWSGAIPATIIYNEEKRKFYEQSFNYEELNHELQQFIK